MHWKQREFEKLYMALLSKREHPRHLAGIVEQGNFLKGLDEWIPEPIFIEDEDALAPKLASGEPNGVLTR